jgi:hypothetical protein
MRFSVVVIAFLLSRGTCSVIYDVTKVSKLNITGRALDCWQGRALPIHDIDVFLYDYGQNPRLRVLLSDLDKLKTSATVNDVNLFIDKYAQLEDLVRRDRTAIAHLKTKKDGRFEFSAANNHRKKILLVIGLGVEDEHSYYNYSIFTTPPQRSLTVWLSDSTGCRTP